MNDDKGVLYEASALDVLDELPRANAQLVYLDPPWFKKHWGPEQSNGQPNAGGERDYLQFISEVLLKSRPVLAETGLVVFHVEPSLSANTRYILDQIFGREQFRYEAVLPLPHVIRASGPAVRHETLLYYSKSNHFKFHPPVRQLSPDEVSERFPLKDESGPFRLLDLTLPRKDPPSQFSWRGITPERRGWKFSREKLDAFAAEGRIYQPEKSSVPRLKQYAAEASAVGVGSVWDDLPLRPIAAERVRFPTQQPVALLERIVGTSSDVGDLIVDPFCGSGSTMVAAQSLKRRWVGADISVDALQLTIKRLAESFGLVSPGGFERRSLNRAPGQSAMDRGVRIQLGIADDTPSVKRRRDGVAYDVFISHASEDKEDFVRPLAMALGRRGFRVWYDEFTLSVGDSLARSIDDGLAQSRFGIVVLSTRFFQKEWPRRELGALVAREIEEGKIILPIWHRVTKDDVLKYSPLLADKIALNSSILGIEQLVDGLEEVIARE
jgi:DNA modification methylase